MNEFKAMITTSCIKIMAEHMHYFKDRNIKISRHISCLSTILYIISCESQVPYEFQAFLLVEFYFNKKC